MATSTAPADCGNFAHAVLRMGALRHPERIAVTHHGERELSYAELDEKVTARAHALLATGLRPGDRVAVLVRDTLEITIAYFALARLGAVIVTLSPAWDLETARAILDRMVCRGLLHDPGADDAVADFRAVGIDFEIVARVGGASEHAIDVNELAESAAADVPVSTAGGADDLAIFFTSGSTGLPKAVVHTHASALAIAQQWLDVPHDDGSAFGTGPIIWGVGFFAIVGPALYAGMRLVLEDDFSPARFGVIAAERGITHISVIPSFFAELLGSNSNDDADFSALRVVLLGGEPLLPSMRERIVKRLPQVALCSFYGQTEGPYSVIGRQDDGSIDIRASGRARTGGAVTVVDADGNRLVNEVGEIRLAGPQIMARYDGDPERTTAVMSDGWYVGGDLGVMDEHGVLTVMGRRDDAVVREGRFVMPSEVEDAAASIDAVLEAGAVAVQTPEAGDRILLAVQLRTPGSLREDELRVELEQRLTPAAWPDAIVVVDELPHADDSSGGRGKLLRREIRAKWQHILG